MNNELRIKKIKNQKEKGFTFIELLIAMGMFTVLISIAVGGFIRVLRTQKNIIELMAANDNANLTIEQMAREIRTGSSFSKISENELQFINAKDIIVFYRLNEESIERGTENASLQKTYQKITADNVRITNFKINLLGTNSGDGYPPRITISLSVTVTSPYFENISTNVQTTISARTLDT